MSVLAQRVAQEYLKRSASALADRYVEVPALVDQLEALSRGYAPAKTDSVVHVEPQLERVILDYTVTPEIERFLDQLGAVQNQLLNLLDENAPRTVSYPEQRVQKQLQEHVSNLIAHYTGVVGAFKSARVPLEALSQSVSVTGPRRDSTRYPGAVFKEYTSLGSGTFEGLTPNGAVHLITATWRHGDAVARKDSEALARDTVVQSKIQKVRGLPQLKPPLAKVFNDLEGIVAVLQFEVP